MYTVLMDNLTIHDPSYNDAAHILMDGVVNKQVNKADSFSFTIYPDNVGYQALDLLTSWISVYKDGNLIFHGRPLTEETVWDNAKNIVCEGDLAILNDTVCRPYSFSGTLGDYVRMLVNQHNAQVGSDKQIAVRTINNSATQIVRRTSEYKATIQELFEKVVNYFGGYIVMEYENGTRYISYLTDSSAGTNQVLEIGKNILDFQRSISSEALATALIPLGAADDNTGERLTIESVNAGSDYITAPEAATRGLIYTAYAWDSVTDATELLNNARALLADLVRIVPRIELSAVDLSDAGYNIDSIGFFEYVTVMDTAHAVSGQYLITERTYNISAPEKDTVTFGSEEKTISGQTARAQAEMSAMNEALINKAVEIVAYQTDLLKGGSGGYFVIGTDVDGHPSEIYFMDTDSTATARSVLRINRNGIGFSTTGFSGPYTNAWTIDGQLNADFITTGTLDADRIAAGSIAIGKLDQETQEKIEEAGEAPVLNLMPSVYYKEITSANPFTSNGITWTTNPDGSVTATGTATALSWYGITSNNLTDAVPVVTIDPTRKYVLHGCPTGGGSGTYSLQVKTYNSGVTPSGSTGTWHADYGSGYVIGTGVKYLYMGIQIDSGYACPSGGVTFYPMLEAGDEIHNYVSSHDGTGALNANIKGANYQEQLIYISKASGTTSVTAPTSWVSNDTGNQNTWTLKRPQYNSSYPVLFVATQRKDVGGAVTCTTPMIDDTTTVIDGGHITTGTIDANNVNVTNINAGNITSGTLDAARISAGSIAIGKLDNSLQTSINGIPVINLLPSVYYTEAAAGKVWTNNGITWTVNADGSVTATGTATAATTYALSGWTLDAIVPAIIASPGEVYSFSHGATGSGWNTTFGYQVAEYNASGTQLRNAAIGDDGRTITIGANTAYIYVRLNIVSGYACPAGGLTLYPMMVKGSSVSGYVSTHNGSGYLTATSQSALSTANDAVSNSAVINIIPSIYYREFYNQPYTSNGITWTVQPDGSVTATGTCGTSNSDYYLTRTSGSAPVPWLYIDPTKRYTMSGVPGVAGCQIRVGVYTETGTSSSVTYAIETSSSQGLVKTTTAGYYKMCVYLRVVANTDLPEGGVTFKPMVEAGTVAHAYVSTHAGTTATLAVEQLIYKSAASGTTTMSAPTSWITATGNSQNTWTTVRPQYSQTYPVLFVATQSKTVTGVISCTTPRIDNTLTIIDGGHIITGTIDADRIAANSTFTQTLYASDFNITGGSVNISTSDDTEDTIILNGANTKVYIGTYGYFVYNKDSGGNYTDQTTINAAAWRIKKAYNGSMVQKLYISGSNISFNNSSGVQTFTVNDDGYLNLSNGTQSIQIRPGTYTMWLNGTNKYTAIMWPDSNGAGRFVLGDGTSTLWRTELTNDGLKFRDSHDAVIATYGNTNADITGQYKSTKAPGAVSALPANAQFLAQAGANNTVAYTAYNTSTTNGISFGLGYGGTNRGLLDIKAGADNGWLIYFDNTNIVLNKPTTTAYQIKTTGSTGFTPTTAGVVVSGANHAAMVVNSTNINRGMSIGVNSSGVMGLGYVNEGADSGWILNFNPSQARINIVKTISVQNTSQYPGIHIRSSDGKSGAYSQIYSNGASVNSIYQTRNICFRNYSYNASTGAALSYSETFSLPVVTTDRTSNVYYNILTTKVTGAITEADPSSGTSIANTTYKSCGSISLAAGTWLVMATVNFAANGTGIRYVIPSYTADSSSTAVHWSAEAITPAITLSGYATDVKTTFVVKHTESKTIYFNCYQNSGSALSTKLRYQVMRIC